MASRSVRILCPRAGVLKLAHRGMSTAAQPRAPAEFLKGESHRKHPGMTNLKTLQLPEQLQAAAQSIVHRAQVTRLADRALKLTNILWSRKRAIDDVTLRKKAVSLEKQLWEKALEKGGDIDEEALEDRIKRKVILDLKRTTYHWTPMKYDEETGVVYMVARLAGGYAAVRRALNEIKKRDPSFAPQTLLDFGSGLGTVVWASHSCWAASLKEMVCVDSSGPMNILAEQLLKGDDDKAEPLIKHVYFRQFLPVSPKVQFDVVVAAFTLSELPNVKAQQEAVLTLWRKTSSYLVLIENGTKESHHLLMEARDTILKNQDEKVYDSRPPSVFAPCPHELMCPKLATGLAFPCNFQQLYHPLPVLRHNNSQTEKFCYLILSRNGRAERGEREDVEWARLVAPVQRRTRHVHCRTCCPDGRLQHIVVTARKHSRDVYRCARNSDWGDQIPMVQSVQEDVESDSE